MDNKAEKYNETSPYAYTLNNPVRFIDPDGNEVTNPKGYVLNNKKLISKIKVLNHQVALRTGLENKDFEIQITGGDRYYQKRPALVALFNGRDPNDPDEIFSLSNDRWIKGSARKSSHLISQGAKAVDLLITLDGNGNVTKDLIDEIAKDLGFVYSKKNYKNDEHVHIQLSASDAEKGLTVDDKNRPTKEELNSELTEGEQDENTKANKNAWERFIKERE